ncbi:MAG: hypothetical protein A2499_11875 [Stygiobacter sp. RIFOXYC12_FULL_38_8]|nr:MAG: hypothetical protein A2X62_07965 [Stygiobacter sp. GWC2_38_9]OGU81703.1 MAG: hypothetical protein A2279_10355 [Stygiobacter sp. RIFOXYA12_FULL_38_9]OGV05807.1 MAG: hypothetical protein A2299_10250 [Stygiobacter sp. RIFOXYB2_FULL_37_11]OGV13015.1 MAG: hypothetical protein A2440_17175 [Stygiobacter sp. RIFOXYC2_FULL_38_25]OGV14867.1 MAG: hypothetical protein A2237_02010 [Stygiobacter sp. RIFOXYA2_FULL_38_8]OGV23688.1 MAG: hypothetical protein A2499_11875 [Stygiobacter sp. RIFOXYC12_FULL_
MEQFDDLNIESESTPAIKPPSQFQFLFDKMTGDMRFVGMFTIIYGVITCLTIIGALFGVPTIIIGLRMREAADQFSMYKATNNAAALRQGFELQGKYFRIIKILIIIGIVFTVLYIILLIYLFTTGLGALLTSPSYSTL